MSQEVIIYKAKDGHIELNVSLSDETVWLTQAQLADFEYGIAFPDLVLDLDTDGIALFCLFNGHIVNLHRIDGHFHISGVAHDVDLVALLQRRCQLDTGDYGVGEEVRYFSDLDFRHLDSSFVVESGS